VAASRNDARGPDAVDRDSAVGTPPGFGASGHSGHVSNDENLDETRVDRWVAPTQMDAVRRDAIALAKSAVSSTDLREVTRMEVLTKYVLVLLTHGTANRKYGTRYRSKGALEVTDPATLEHEHVYPRKWLIEQMLDSPSAVELVLTHFAIACTVTTDEHRLLARAEKANPKLADWERYHTAGVEVIDMATGVVVPQSVGQRPPLPHDRPGE